MSRLLESFFTILKKIPYGESVVGFLSSMPTDIVVVGLLLGFFSAAASWGDPHKRHQGVRAVLERIYKISGVISGLLCVILGIYIIATKTVLVFFYVCALLLGTVANHLLNYFLGIFGKAGNYFMFLLGSFAGVASLALVWFFYHGSLLSYLARITK